MLDFLEGNWAIVDKIKQLLRGKALDCDYSQIFCYVLALTIISQVDYVIQFNVDQHIF